MITWQRPAPHPCQQDFTGLPSQQQNLANLLERRRNRSRECEACYLATTGVTATFTLSIPPKMPTATARCAALVGICHARLHVCVQVLQQEMPRDCDGLCMFVYKGGRCGIWGVVPRDACGCYYYSTDRGMDRVSCPTL